MKDVMNFIPSEEISFSKVQLKTGVRLHYAERGKREGEVIIFLHGYTDSCIRLVLYYHYYLPSITLFH